MRIQRFCAIIIMCFAFTHFAAGQKTDTLFLNNGDRIIGELKSLEYGMVRWSTNAAGTINIKWDYVQRIDSNKEFEITFTNGFLLLGRFDSLSVNGVIIRYQDQGVIRTDMKDIVDISPVKNAFWKRWDGNIDLGFNFNKGTNILALNTNGYAIYNVDRYAADFRLNSTVSTNLKDSTENQNHDFTIQGIRKFQNFWSLILVGALEQNTQIGLQLRRRGGIAGGYEFVHTQRTNVFLSVGITGNRESNTEGDEGNNNLEGSVTLGVKQFKVTEPDMDIQLTVATFPGISDWGRIRVNTDIKAKIDIIKDFYLSLTFYHKFDNRPITENASNSDFGITFGLGYSF